jgi:hypothetical protein
MVLIRLGQTGVLFDADLTVGLMEDTPFSTGGVEGTYKFLVVDDEISILSRHAESSGWSVFREHSWYKGKWSVYLVCGWGDYYEIQDEESVANLRTFFGR